ncbi:MAG: DnaD domain protein, partial [Erysipelotrichaceae bacterium]|nr:DnaD domain protein [Erysipelotrichaceae bacterium]
MSTISIRDRRLAGATMLPDEFVDYYLPQANGDYVKIYLYLLRSVHSGSASPTIASLADVFHLTERDVHRALTYWKDAGLLELTYKDDELDSILLLPVSQTLHETQKDPIAEQLAAEEISSGQANAQVSSSRLKELRADDASREDIKSILFITEQYLGHTLSSTDIRRLAYLYDDLHMSVDLIDYLVEYCAGRDGKNMAYIMKVGLAWHDEGIRTVKEAKSRNMTSM